ADTPPPVTAIRTVAAGRFRNAMPSPIASSTGNTSNQNNASGSRRNSRKRVRVSSRIDENRSDALLLTQVASGKRDENVFQCRRVSLQLREPQVTSLEIPE